MAIRCSPASVGMRFAFPTYKTCKRHQKAIYSTYLWRAAYSFGWREWRLKIAVQCGLQSIAPPRRTETLCLVSSGERAIDARRKSTGGSAEHPRGTDAARMG